jgi:NAD(P)H-hydrate epimerase
MPTPDAHQIDRTEAGRRHWKRTKPAYVLTCDAVREVDRAAIEDFSIPGIVLMENAARGLAQAAIDLIERTVPARDEAGEARVPRVLIVCGSGNNGGDGFALARHLHNAGLIVAILPIGEPRSGSDAAINREICRRMNLHEVAKHERDEAFGRETDLIVDAIFGTGLDREITGPPREIIERINSRHAPVLAVDVPSGLNCDTGETLGVVVTATMTVTFVALKPAFQMLETQRVLGEVRVVDIGAPRDLIERLGTRLPARPPDAGR